MSEPQRSTRADEQPTDDAPRPEDAGRDSQPLARMLANPRRTRRA